MLLRCQVDKPELLISRFRLYSRVEGKYLHKHVVRCAMTPVHSFYTFRRFVKRYMQRSALHLGSESPIAKLVGLEQGQLDSVALHGTFVKCHSYRIVPTLS